MLYVCSVPFSYVFLCAAEGDEISLGTPAGIAQSCLPHIQSNRSYSQMQLVLPDYLLPTAPYCLLCLLLFLYMDLPEIPSALYPLCPYQTSPCLLSGGLSRLSHQHCNPDIIYACYPSAAKGVHTLLLTKQDLLFTDLTLPLLYSPLQARLLSDLCSTTLCHFCSTVENPCFWCPCPAAV